MADRLYRKTSVDMTIVQGIWSIWIAVIVLVVYVVSRIMGVEIQASGQIGELVTRIMTGDWVKEFEKANSGFFTFIAHPAKIFMFACGIISLAFLTYVVRQGVTRKAYFIGTVIASVVLSFAIAAGSGLIYLVERMLFGLDIELDQMWLLAVAAFAVNNLLYYVFGWLIGAGFYRFGIGGFLFIALAIAFAFAAEALWGTVFMEWFNLSNLTWFLTAIIGSLVLLVILLGSIRMITRNIRVRLK